MDLNSGTTLLKNTLKTLIVETNKIYKRTLSNICETMLDLLSLPTLVYQRKLIFLQKLRDA